MCQALQVNSCMQLWTLASKWKWYFDISFRKWYKHVINLCCHLTNKNKTDQMLSIRKVFDKPEWSLPWRVSWPYLASGWIISSATWDFQRSLSLGFLLFLFKTAEHDRLRSQSMHKAVKWPSKINSPVSLYLISQSPAHFSLNPTVHSSDTVQVFKRWQHTNLQTKRR